MLADYHMHTSFSDDSTFAMEELINKAISLGIDEVCFTEHVDHGVKTVSNCDYAAYIKEFQRCQAAYQDQIKLKLGIEFGMQVHTVETYQRDFDHHDFDFVLLSCHQVDDQEFWRQDFQRGKSQQEYNEKYYQEILNVVKIYNDYSVLGHLDVIRRYDDAGPYPFEKVKPIITEILQHVIAQGKGIEINTSSFRYGLDDLMPSRDILKLYHELGGTIITTGSDTHEEAHVGHQIGFVKAELKKLGFKQFCTFEKMQPVFHPL